MDQAVEDLLWVVNGAPFVAGPGVAAPAVLDRGQVDPASLRDFLAPRHSHRVGRYFEALLHFWIERVRGLEVIGAGIPVRDDKRTIGEVDFLFRDESETITHCEAAVKFFLHFPRDGTSDFPGPNASDNFERKVARLFDHQLRLSETHFPEVECREAFVRGMVFYRPGEDTPDELPDRMAVDHERGQWLRESELGLLLQRPGCAGAIVAKPYWLAPQVQCEVLALPHLVDRLRRHFRERQHPLLISLRSEATGEEAERVFVVSEMWPF